jgi:hypothetical protein
MKKFPIFILVLLLLIPIVYSVDFVPTGNVNGKNVYNIYNFKNITNVSIVNATTFYGNGAGITNLSSTSLNINTTQMNTSGGVLNILTSWLHSLFYYNTEVYNKTEVYNISQIDAQQLAQNNTINSKLDINGTLNKSQIRNFDAQCTAGNVMVGIDENFTYCDDVTKYNDSARITSLNNTLNSSYVPYTGANQNVNIGNHSLTIGQPYEYRNLNIYGRIDMFSPLNNNGLSIYQTQNDVVNFEFNNHGNPWYTYNFDNNLNITGNVQATENVNGRNLSENGVWIGSLYNDTALIANLNLTKANLAGGNNFTGHQNFQTANFTGIVWINNINSTNVTGFIAADSFIEDGVTINSRYNDTAMITSVNNSLNNTINNLNLTNITATTALSLATTANNTANTANNTANSHTLLISGIQSNVSAINLSLNTTNTLATLANITANTANNTANLAIPKTGGNFSGYVYVPNFNATNITGVTINGTYIGLLNKSQLRNFDAQCTSGNFLTGMDENYSYCNLPTTANNFNITGNTTLNLGPRTGYVCYNGTTGMISVSNTTCPLG